MAAASTRVLKPFTRFKYNNLHNHTHGIAVSCTTSSRPMDLDVALSPGFADARLGLLMFALFEGVLESSRNRLDLSRVATRGSPSREGGSESLRNRLDLSRVATEGSPSCMLCIQRERSSARMGNQARRSGSVAAAVSFSLPFSLVSGCRLSWLTKRQLDIRYNAFPGPLPGKTRGMAAHRPLCT